ncbi:MAG: hypothetical protein NVSMB1_19510 [Polyangiales bacterium]
MHPSQTVKEKFGDKKKLVEALQPFLGDDLWVSRANQGKGLAHVSNAKLLRLFETFTAVQSKWGTRAKLITAIVEAEGRAKDTGYRTRLEVWSVPRLYDHFKAVTKRSGAPTSEAAPKKPKEEGLAAKATKAVKEVVTSAKTAATGAATKASAKKTAPEPKKSAKKAKKSGSKRVWGLGSKFVRGPRDSISWPGE